MKTESSKISNINCLISGKSYHPEHAIPFVALDKNMQNFIKNRYSDADEESYIGEDQVIGVRKEYLNQILSEEIGELDELEREVVTSISENKLLSEKVEDTIEEKSTFGEKIADRIATFGGSWTFIIAFFTVLSLWMLLNIWGLHDKGFDPYPFILLNLLLSCLAAIQAPIIMMSQNRQETKDRIRSEHDYKINLKAELEIQLLHKKIDHILIHQNKRLMEIQRIQNEMTDAIIKKLSEVRPG